MSIADMKEAYLLIYRPDSQTESYLGVYLTMEDARKGADNSYHSIFEESISRGDASITWEGGEIVILPIEFYDGKEP